MEQFFGGKNPRSIVSLIKKLIAEKEEQSTIFATVKQKAQSDPFDRK